MTVITLETKKRPNKSVPKPPPTKVGEGSKKTKGKKSKSKRKVLDKGPDRAPADILDPAAMNNLHLIAHNAPEALAYRGFNWSGNKKKKGKKQK
ncbi:unnamed protein product [Rodentolepis nana]|uniref:Small lysine-rich protein 1 n=1 Tax=Rodentolepis nana TaxID=102285 RepID=A0A0R3T7Z5_RODNA|nr:unnamed protein product [Rodentolepis nana]